MIDHGGWLADFLEYIGGFLEEFWRVGSSVCGHCHTEGLVLPEIEVNLCDVRHHLLRLKLNLILVLNIETSLFRTNLEFMKNCM